MSNYRVTCHFTPSSNIHTLLDRNKDWAERLDRSFPDLFPAIAGEQHPEILWLGCSDSRVPETNLLDLLPGEVFVHRNIANVLPYGDLSSLSVIQYAVEHLKVHHIIVCGHYNCGGVKAALGDKTGLGFVDSWLKYVREVRAKHKAELDAIPDFTKRSNRLVELNVIAQVQNLKRLSNVEEAIKTRGVQVHGFVFDVGSGNLRLLNIPPDEDAVIFGGCCSVN